MNNRNLRTIVSGVMVTALMTLSGGLAFADKGGHMTPELAAKKEMVRKQQEQRITPEKRKAAVDALKAERIRVYQAKQAVKQSSPSSFDNK